jgi:hypothetical protein
MYTCLLFAAFRPGPHIAPDAPLFGAPMIAIALLIGM